MAATKTKKRAAPKGASSQKQKAQKPKKAAKPKSRAKSSSTKSRPKASATGNGSGPVDAVRETIEDKAKDARKAVSGAADKAGEVASKAGGKAGDAASKAKIPLLAGGAALAGAAGGIALAATRQGNHRGALVKAMRKPRIKLDSDDIAKAAKQVGKFSAQVGEVAGGVQRASESTNGNGHHRRSPIEVVLQGLTARR
jgi:hypothetical protein